MPCVRVSFLYSIWSQYLLIVFNLFLFFFLKFNIFVPFQIETKFNLCILKCIFLLNIFNVELELV